MNNEVVSVFANRRDTVAGTRGIAGLDLSNGIAFSFTYVNVLLPVLTHYVEVFVNGVKVGKQFRKGGFCRSR